MLQVRCGYFVYLKCLKVGGGGEANIWNLENPKPFDKKL